MSAPVEHVRRALRSAATRVPDVFASDARLVVGFSGGQDSTCLLHALAHAHRGLDLLAVHVDHALRAGSARDAERVVALGESMGVPTRVLAVQVSRSGSRQQAARRARYAALAVAAQEHNAKAVMVAHTADDQAETVLLNLLRGTGLVGVAGMRLDQPGDEANRMPRLVRPLLGVPRSTTLAYCQQLGLQLVEDASNRTRAYTRNRVRLDVLPVLERFNPAVREALARAADLSNEDEAVLEELASSIYGRVWRGQDFDLRTFRAQPRALQRRVLRCAMKATLSSLTDVTAAPIEDALDLLQTGQANQTYHLPYGVELCIGRESFALRRDGRARQRTRNNLDVTGPRV